MAADQKVITLTREKEKLESDKSNLEYREQNLLIANQLLRGKADDAHSRMLHFKVLN